MDHRDVGSYWDQNAAAGKQAEYVYAYYTACPKCAKHYGKNYVVLLAKTD